MKKLILSMVALVALTMVACGPNKTVEAQTKMYTEAMAKMDSLSTFADWATFQQDFAAAQLAFAEANAEAIATISAEDQTAIAAVASQFAVKMQTKSDSLASIAAALAAADTVSMTVIETATAL